jgi:hypothetical protein
LGLTVNPRDPATEAGFFMRLALHIQLRFKEKQNIGFGRPKLLCVLRKERG